MTDNNIPISPSIREGNTSFSYTSGTPDRVYNGVNSMSSVTGQSSIAGEYSQQYNQYFQPQSSETMQLSMSPSRPKLSSGPETGWSQMNYRFQHPYQFQEPLPTQSSGEMMMSDQLLNERSSIAQHSERVGMQNMEWGVNSSSVPHGQSSVVDRSYSAVNGPVQQYSHPHNAGSYQPYAQPQQQKFSPDTHTIPQPVHQQQNYNRLPLSPFSNQRQPQSSHHRQHSFSPSPNSQPQQTLSSPRRNLSSLSPHSERRQSVSPSSGRSHGSNSLRSQSSTAPTPTSQVQVTPCQHYEYPPATGLAPRMTANILKHHAAPPSVQLSGNEMGSGKMSKGKSKKHLQGEQNKLQQKDSNSSDEAEALSVSRNHARSSSIPRHISTASAGTQHHAGSGLPHPCSPAGSVSSRSNTPASLSSGSGVFSNMPHQMMPPPAACPSHVGGTAGRGISPVPLCRIPSFGETTIMNSGGVNANGGRCARNSELAGSGMMYPRNGESQYFGPSQGMLNQQPQVRYYPNNAEAASQDAGREYRYVASNHQPAPGNNINYHTTGLPGLRQAWREEAPYSTRELQYGYSNHDTRQSQYVDSAEGVPQFHPIVRQDLAQSTGMQLSNSVVSETAVCEDRMAVDRVEHRFKSVVNGGQGKIGTKTDTDRDRSYSPRSISGDRMVPAENTMSDPDQNASYDARVFERNDNSGLYLEKMDPLRGQTVETSDGRKIEDTEQSSHRRDRMVMEEERMITDEANSGANYGFDRAISINDPLAEMPGLHPIEAYQPRSSVLDERRSSIDVPINPSPMMSVNGQPQNLYPMPDFQSYGQGPPIDMYRPPRHNFMPETRAGNYPHRPHTEMYKHSMEMFAQNADPYQSAVVSENNYMRRPHLMTMYDQSRDFVPRPNDHYMSRFPVGQSQPRQRLHQYLPRSSQMGQNVYSLPVGQNVYAPPHEQHLYRPSIGQHLRYRAPVEPFLHGPSPMEGYIPRSHMDNYMPEPMVDQYLPASTMDQQGLVSKDQQGGSFVCINSQNGSSSDRPFPAAGLESTRQLSADAVSEQQMTLENKIIEHGDSLCLNIQERRDASSTSDGRQLTSAVQGQQPDYGALNIRFDSDESMTQSSQNEESMMSKGMREISEPTHGSATDMAIMSKFKSEENAGKTNKSKMHDAILTSSKVAAIRQIHSPPASTGEDNDNSSNTSWPSTPTSGQNEVLNKLVEMGSAGEWGEADARDRRAFLERLFSFMEERGTPILAVPTISKQLVDLFRLYCVVQDYGGMVEVTREKKWREVSTALNMGPSSSAGFTLKKNYGKHLFPYECRFDRGNVDPVPILAYLEQPIKKESKRAAAERAAERASVNAPDMYHMESYGYHQYPGTGMGNEMIPYGQHPGNLMPPPHSLPGFPLPRRGVSCNDTINVQNPFSDAAMMSIHQARMNSQQRGGMNWVHGSGGDECYPFVTRGPDGRFAGSFAGEANFFHGNSRGAVGIGEDGQGHSDCPLQSDTEMVERGIGGETQFNGINTRPSATEGVGDPQTSSELPYPPSLDSREAPRFDRHLPDTISMDRNASERGVMEKYHDTNITQSVTSDVATGFIPSRQDARGTAKSETLGYEIGQLPFYGTRSDSEPRTFNTFQSHGRPPYSIRRPYDSMSPYPNHGVSEVMTDNSSYRFFNPIGRGDFMGRGYYPSPPPNGIGYAGMHQRIYTGSWSGRFQPSLLHQFTADNQQMEDYVTMQQADKPVIVKKEMMFPSDCIESIKPHITEHQKLTHKHLGPVDPWRIMMSLRSGLIVESTWALDVLAILLDEDASWFSLSHLPGLINVLLEHFRRCLYEIFGTSFDNETAVTPPSPPPILEKESHQLFDRTPSLTPNLSSHSSAMTLLPPDLSDSGLDSSFERDEAPDYTLMTRDGRTVLVESSSAEHDIMFDEKVWDDSLSRTSDEKVASPQTVDRCSLASFHKDTMHIVTHFSRVAEWKFLSHSFFGAKRAKYCNCLRRAECSHSAKCGAEDARTKSSAENVSMLDSKDSILPPSLTVVNDSDDVDVKIEICNKNINARGSLRNESEDKLKTADKSFDCDYLHVLNTCNNNKEECGENERKKLQTDRKDPVIGFDIAKFKRMLTVVSADKVTSRVHGRLGDKVGGRGLDNLFDSIKHADINHDICASQQLKSNISVEPCSNLQLRTDTIESIEILNVAQNLSSPVKNEEKLSVMVKLEIDGDFKQANSINNIDVKPSINADHFVKCSLLENDGKQCIDHICPQRVSQCFSQMAAANHTYGKHSFNALTSHRNCNSCNDDMEECFQQRAIQMLERKWSDDAGDFIPDDTSNTLYLTDESRKEVAYRCVCISNVLRALSFVPGNGIDICQHTGLLITLGKLILFRHSHSTSCEPDAAKTASLWQAAQERNVCENSLTFTVNRQKYETSNGRCSPDSMDVDDVEMDSLEHWRDETLNILRDDTLVVLANIAGQLDLAAFEDGISRPILDGLLHWAVCPVDCATASPPPSEGGVPSPSPRHLALEALCKLCITDSNVDLVLAVGPYERIVRLLVRLVQTIADDSTEQAVREFAIVIIGSMVNSGDDGATARMLALYHPTIGVLLDLLETVEVLGVCEGSSCNDDGTTSSDILRRAAGILRAMVEVPDNRARFLLHRPRLLALATSRVFDDVIADILAEILFYCSTETI